MLTTTTTTKGTKTAHYVPDYDQSNSMESHHTCPACGVQAHQMTNALSRTYACRNCGAIVCAHYDHALQKVERYRIISQMADNHYRILANSQDRCVEIFKEIADYHDEHRINLIIVPRSTNPHHPTFTRLKTQCKPAHCGSFTKVSLD